MSRRTQSKNVKVEMFDVFLDLHKCGLGMSIKGGIENNCDDIYISHIDPRGAVCEDGRLQLGDVITAVNKNSLYRVTQKTAEKHVIEAINDIPYVHFSVRRTIPQEGDDDDDDSETENEPLILDNDNYSYNNNHDSWPDNDVYEDNNNANRTNPSTSGNRNSSQIVNVTLTRGRLGFGFTLTGGSDNQIAFNDTGLYIYKIVDQSPAHLSGQVDVGDQILAVNRYDLECVSYQKALDVIRNAPDQTVFTIRKNITWD